MCRYFDLSIYQIIYSNFVNVILIYRFLFEHEKKHRIAILDVDVSHEEIIFFTTAYKEPTTTNVYTDFEILGHVLINLE